ncbi:MAG: hypothetical protein ACE5HV_10415 [Acidobacteriota bacterium]
MQLRSASGRASLRGLIALLLVGTAVYVGMKMIPVRASAYAFEDAVRDQVIFAASRRRRATDENIRQALIERAATLGLPIRGRDIAIRRPGSKYLIVEVAYTVDVDFAGIYVYPWHFEARYEGPVIF